MMQKIVDFVMLIASGVARKVTLPVPAGQEKRDKSP